MTELESALVEGRSPDVRESRNTLRWSARLGEFVCLAVVVTLLAAVLVRMARETGVTVDEPSHLLSAALYWEGRDTLQPGDMPPLIKIVGGWVPALAGLRLPSRDHKVWETRHEWPISLQMMSELKSGEVERIFFWSRLPFLVFPIGCVALLWWWGRQLASPWAGLAAAAVFAMLPTVLGHGALFKNDLAASFGYLFFWYRAWRYWRSPSTGQAAVWALALLIAVLAKFSMLVLIPVAALILVARRLTGSQRNPRKFAIEAGAVALCVYAGIVLAWQADVTPLTAKDFDQWRAHPAIPRLLTRFVKVAQALPTPPRLWRGAMGLVQSNGEMAPTYLLGQVYQGGHPLYFAIALLVKMPVAALALIGMGLGLFLKDVARRRARLDDLFWAAPGFLYLMLASASSLQLGVRLVLPAVAVLALYAGRLIGPHTPARPMGAVVILLLAWLGVRSYSVFPDYISHFNVLAGGADRGLQYLSDSNVDWGQDLRRFARMVKEQPLGKVRLAYFGTDNVWAYVSDKEVETIAPPWSGIPVNGRHFRPEPGVYAISATLLTGQLFAEEYRDYYREFRKREPFAKAGYSLFLFHIP